MILSQMSISFWHFYTISAINSANSLFLFNGFNSPKRIAFLQKKFEKFANVSNLVQEAFLHAAPVRFSRPQPAGAVGKIDR
jgi:hypothetical protein